MIKKAALQNQTESETFRTGISLPKNVHRAAMKKSANDRRSFSNYVQILIERDLEKEIA